MDGRYGAVCAGEAEKSLVRARFALTAIRHVADAGYRVLNVDSTLILTAPKTGPHATAIRQRLAELLNLEPEAVGVKAKTPEGLNLDNTAMAHVVVLLGRR